eukprot:TRINITY_DN5024_c0_g1_i1.p1 TRINITY_DN5024_c0_g1~~TRINITY_DN5024_c0_g1_i1.p1  ORF type:complete len:348 (+),score=56.36 TRINITY_DN5024_c0_g1_i1:51-1094(+)
MSKAEVDISELAEYDSDDEQTVTNTNQQASELQKGGIDSHSALHISSFKEFLLKPELLKAISDSGFEHPSQVQYECIPSSLSGKDVICQAKSGMGKTAVFVLSVLQICDITEPPQIGCVVLCHVRELAYQIKHEFDRFKVHLSPEVKTAVVYGGVPVNQHKAMLRKDPPHILIGTPGRMVQLLNEGAIKLHHVKHFILDECDKMIESMSMRSDVQTIFKATPHEKQVMMFSATLSKQAREDCKKFMTDPMEIYVDDGAKLTLTGLQQYYVNLTEREKNRKLVDLLDQLQFNQVVIFVKSVKRAQTLNKLLQQCNFPSVCVHSRMAQQERYCSSFMLKIKSESTNFHI